MAVLIEVCKVCISADNIVGINDDLHTLLVVSYGFHFFHDFLFAERWFGGTTANEAVQHLLTGLNLPTKLANEFAEKRPIYGWKFT